MGGCVYINPDVIAQQEFGGWNSQEAFIKAANRSKEMREECLSSFLLVVRRNYRFYIEKGVINGDYW